MITAIREVRRARGMTLDDVARACVPPTTPQTIGRLETGTRTVSVAWLNRIAAALGVEASDLVQTPERDAPPVAALLDEGGARAPRRALTSPPPAPAEGQIAVLVAAGVGDYRAGDAIWCEPLVPSRFAEGLNRDVLVPQPAGRYLFGRMLGLEGGRVLLLPPGHASKPRAADAPPWIARATHLIRGL